MLAENLKGTERIEDRKRKEMVKLRAKKDGLFHSNIRHLSGSGNGLFYGWLRKNTGLDRKSVFTKNPIKPYA